MSGGVPPWATNRSLHPTLRIGVAATSDELLQALGWGLERAGFELGDRGPDRFSARHADPAVVRVLKPVEATVLDVTVTSGPTAAAAGAEATVRVRTGPQRRVGVRRAAAGLSQSVDELGRRHLKVTVLPWDYGVDGSARDEIPGWDKHVQSFHPQMSLRAAVPAHAALDAVARGLKSSGYRITRATPAGFRASYHNWLRFGLELATFVGASADRTTLDVDASAASVASVVTIRVTGGFEHWGPRDRAAQGLTAAMRELRSQGHEVAATPWVDG